ncbi:hypothetical protein V473_08625 [Sphingobium cupriresistens LL01]|uniref:Uncharacterized protein n=1 Tax=Sphingobium cupriresistens LL01 TaxID=1420583 RepID=A0A0J7Y549_9SPHN|nr:hypothetical protein V473_08625 [Sphingobium cupriresistens LL01]
MVHILENGRGYGADDLRDIPGTQHFLATREDLAF